MLDLTGRSTKVLEYASAEAVAMGHSVVGTEHILLGLIKETSGVANYVLLRHGLTYNALRAEICGLVGVADTTPVAVAPPRIVYDEMIVDRIRPDVRIIARLFTDGTLQVGRTEDALRQVVFFQDTQTNKPWIPDRATFLATMTETIEKDEYDLDGDIVCLDSFMSDLRRSLLENKQENNVQNSQPDCSL